MNWYDDLCEYYKVTPEEANLLGTRKKGRKPNLPGSPTCAPVFGKTFEEIWDSKPRENSAQIFEFYKEIGSWSSFRQCKYHEHGPAYGSGHEGLKHLKDREINSTVNILEYGSGVAPVSNWLADNVKNLNFNFYINDVPSEHLTFGEWRLRKRRQNVKKFEIKPDVFPEYGDVKFDLIFMLDVLEHMDKPYAAIESLLKYCKPNKTTLIETWIDHTEQEEGTGCDLDREKKETVKLIRSNFSMVRPGILRSWKKLTFF
jgi:2-polyprenyl-3-methyl-5-hydroxy-6-metoxy-1,4-benzoquinol methylase